jgi:LmbE family N-acetylglucosaminyl deacetylase
MQDQRLTLMAVHAHPDDEATGTGGVLAKAAAEGIRTVLVTCTDGGCGDGPDGVKPGEPGHDPRAVAAFRRGELDASCAVLGIEHLELLGYADSGMVGWATNDAPGSFWSTPVDEAAARLAELLERYRPDVVVTYDENGFYGHPDHIQAHRITMAAIEATAATGTPAKVYWTTVPRASMVEFGRMAREQGLIPADGPDLGEMPDFGVPDDEVTTWVDVSKYVERKRAAMAAHASQSDSAMFLAMAPEVFATVMGVETFLRVQDSTGTPPPEDDLFAGLR